MRKELCALTVGAAALALGGCCAGVDVRHWRVTELTTSRVFYAADTALEPINASHPVFISADRKLVGLASYTLEPIDAATFHAESGATTRVRAMYYPGRGNVCSAEIQFDQATAPSTRAEE